MIIKYQNKITPTKEFDFSPCHILFGTKIPADFLQIKY